MSTEGDKPGSKTTPTEVESPKVEEPKRKVRKQWKNPALRALGVPRPNLPSRNWMIFWTVLASIGGGIAYDKYEQKKVRAKWMKIVEPYSQEVYPNDRLPRKLSIFIAPPPNDFLESSLKYFRRYIKPVLNASAIDYDIYTENRQGDIRAQVAEKIRQLRREKSQLLVEPTTEIKKESYWTKFIKLFKRKEKEQEQDKEVLVNRRDLYKPDELLGLYQIFSTKEVKRDDELCPTDAGGIICVGRGAYKEYMVGVHEGLLGPLEKPIEELPAENKKDGEEEEGKKHDTNNNNNDNNNNNNNNSNNNNDDDDDESNVDPVPKPYILPKDYASASFAPEFDSSGIILDSKNVPVLFEQPVYVFPVPKLQGMANIPRKIFNFYNLRYLADDYGARTHSIIANVHRPFEYKDVFMAGEEEKNWPKNWVKKGKEKGSEWVQELEVDERIIKRMKVFDPSLHKPEIGNQVKDN